MYKKIRNKKGFSLAEAMITLMIISLILAAVIPVMSRRQLTSDSMWKYAGNNSDIYYGEGASQAAIIGANSVPTSSTGAKMVIVTHADSNGDTIKHSLIDFYQKTSAGIKNIGRISFDDTYANLAIGRNTLKNLTSTSAKGKYNLAVGHDALSRLTSADANVAIGYNSQQLNQAGTQNVSLGCSTLQANKANYNTAIGDAALKNNDTGSANTAVGEDSLALNTSGTANTAVGRYSMRHNTSASNNTAVGAFALQGTNEEFTGSYNTAVGSQALMNVTSGEQNAAFGDGALAGNTSGIQNTALGSSTLLFNVTGKRNVAVGDAALAYSKDGHGNISIGASSMFNNDTGCYNVAIGERVGNAIKEGSYNIIIGSFAGPTTDQSSQLFIDVSQRNDPLIWGHFTGRQVKINGALFTTSGSLAGSDAAMKNIGKDYKVGLENIIKLKVKNYTYKDDKTKRLHHGVIAQELQKIMPDAIVKGPQDKLYVDINEVVFTLVNAVKQLHTKISNNFNEIQKLKSENLSLKKEVMTLKSQNKDFEKRLKILENK